MTDTPKPGIYENVPFDKYLSWDAISASRIKLASRSMAHYYAGFVGRETQPMRLGSLVHTGKLEPLSLAERYVVMPQYQFDADNKSKDGAPSRSKSTAYYQLRKREFEDVNSDKIVVERTEFDTMRGVVESLSSNVDATRVLSGLIEVSLVWSDPETGLLCKCRIDALNIDAATIGDLKTTEDCTRFDRAIKRWQYDVQMAHYRIGVKETFGIDTTPWLVPVETVRPFGSMAAPLAPTTIERGEKIRRRRMLKIEQCKKTNNWPGYTSPDSWLVEDFEVSKPAEITVGGKTVVI